MEGATLYRFPQQVSLAAQLKEVLSERGAPSVAEVAKAIGYGRSTVSLYLSGRYESDKFEQALAEWLAQHRGSAVASPRAQPLPSDEFFASNDAKMVLGVCQYCQEYREMGIITGRSGFGKSYALKEYAKLPKVCYLECDVTMSPRDLLRALEAALGLPSRQSTNHERSNAIIDFLRVNSGYVLLIDEADKLMSKYTHNKMHILRAIFDRSCGMGDRAACGLVIAGEPRLAVQIAQSLDQYAKRTLAGTELRGLREREVEAYLADYDIEPEALAELKTRALNARSGCFRLLDRTMRNVRRMLTERGGERITLALIEQASSLMLL